MKGQKKIKLNGNDVKLRFTVGVFEDFQDYVESLPTELTVDDALQKMKHLRYFLHLMTVAAGETVDPEKFRDLEFDQMEEALKLMNVGKPGKAEKK